MAVQDLCGRFTKSVNIKPICLEWKRLENEAASAKQGLWKDENPVAPWISSNLPFSKWEQIFKDPMTTAAAIDRLVHHSIILELNISSYRLEASKKEKK